MTKAKNVLKQNSIMQKLLEDNVSDIKQFRAGDLVDGIVVSASHKEVLLDVGAKSEGIVTGEELGETDSSYKNLKPGDTVLATVLQAENDQGYIVLSLRRAERERRWRDIENSNKSGSALEVTVIEYNKGGLLVDCMGLRGFVPLSHLDRVHFSDNNAKFASGNVLKVKVIEFDKEKNRLVLSEKDAGSAYSDEAKKEKLGHVTNGDILDGIVTGIMPFGIFVDLDGLEGLVHISEIAWEKVSHPSDYFTVGSKISVKVLGVDEKSGKLALSVKKLTDNPWENVETKYPVGATVKGIVSKVVPFGAFINLEKGLDGLVHVSETEGPLEEGQKVSAVVTLVDGENQKLALSIRQLKKS